MTATGFWNRDGKAFVDLSPKYHAAEALIARVVVEPGRLREISADDTAQLIWHRAMSDPKWPKLRAELLQRGHTEDDVNSVCQKAATFALDVARERARLRAGQVKP